MTKLLVVGLIALTLYWGSAFSRELREQSLEEKVSVSELIFVGNVVAIERPHEVDGVNALAVVRVVDHIKGTDSGDELRFVIRGAVVDDNPDCCNVGYQYLFFAVKGVQVLEFRGNEIEGILDHTDGFISATNGRFSTYPVVAGVVNGWMLDGKRVDTPLPVVRNQINKLGKKTRKKTRTPTPATPANANAQRTSKQKTRTPTI